MENVKLSLTHYLLYTDAFSFFILSFFILHRRKMAAVPTAAKLIFLLFFFYLAVNLVQSSNIKPQVPAEDEEKLYVLALQWGISFCRDQSRVVCRQPVLQNFTIHGLWLYGQEYTGNILPPYTARMDLFRYRSGVSILTPSSIYNIKISYASFLFLTCQISLVFNEFFSYIKE